jgi:hypothetical protein
VAEPIAVVVGSIGKLPLAGHTVFNLHHLAGLQELGYDVHYVERLNEPGDACDPRTGERTSSSEYAVEYLRSALGRLAIDDHRWTFLDLDGTCHGSGREGLEHALDHAEFVLSVTDPTWFDDLERCERRAHIDRDPMFTQVALETGQAPRALAPGRYPVLFTYGVRIGSDDCAIPEAGREWLPARPVVATTLWRYAPPDLAAPVTALLQWRTGGELEWEGRTYGQNDSEFMRFAALPRRAPEWRYLLAAGGGEVPREELEELGWELESPLELSRSVARYAAFVRESGVELGVAKDAYVASRSGWFSDRATSFLASGRPVLHQETGFSEWLPADEGVLAFSDLDELVDRLDEIAFDYRRHARVARELAEDHFEARRVLGGMLEAAGFR